MTLKVAGALVVLTLAAPTPGLLRQTPPGAGTFAPRIASVTCEPAACRAPVGRRLVVRAVFSDRDPDDVLLRVEWAVSPSRDGQFYPVARVRARNEATLRFASARPVTVVARLTVTDVRGMAAVAYRRLEATPRWDVPA